MYEAKDMSATKAGENNLPPAAPAGVHGAEELEAQLARILARVPPILKLPKPKQRCFYCNQSRTGLRELVAPCERNGFKPPVKAIYRRSHKHAVRGQWLIPAENLFRYLLGLAERAEADYAAATKLRRLCGEIEEPHAPVPRLKRNSPRPKTAAEN